MKRECSHVCVDIDQWGKTSFTYCPFPVVTSISGVDYCRNHGRENERREKIHDLLAQINENRPQT